MRCKSIRAGLTVLLLACFPTAYGASPDGRWQTIDDETGQPKSIITLTQASDGSLNGRVTEILQSDKGPNPRCEKCEGERHNQPIVGMTILWDLRPEGNNAWNAGTILDPSKGKTYRAKAKLAEDGQTLEVSGCIVFICRSQTWLREP